MKKAQIIKTLKTLDSMLLEPLEITICGGASAILFHGINRTTKDIDVLTSIPKLSKTINEKNGKSRKLTEIINDGAKGFENILDANYKKRRVQLSEDFNKLKVFSISKVNFFIMKLASMRATDIMDISNLSLDQNELAILEEAVVRISKFNAKTAMNMDIFIKEYKLHEH